MSQTKVCPYCKRKFVAYHNAKKYCRQRCADLEKKRNSEKSSKSRLCQWCGKIFKSVRKRKFCTDGCRNCYMSELSTYCKRTQYIPVKVTLKDADAQSKKEGLTYGRYISIHKIK